MTIPSIFQVVCIVQYICKLNNTNSVFSLVCFFKYCSMAIQQLMKGSLRPNTYIATLIYCASRITTTV